MPRRTARNIRKSGFAGLQNSKPSLAFSPSSLGQSCPQRCPGPDDVGREPLADPLGQPLSVREAARLIGCSPWTVRQRYLPAGLPHHRATPNGKLIFYRTQVIRWLLSQQKGGRSA